MKLKELENIALEVSAAGEIPADFFSLLMKARKLINLIGRLKMTEAEIRAEAAYSCLVGAYLVNHYEFIFNFDPYE